jgi:hypothetical protein
MVQETEQGERQIGEAKIKLLIIRNTLGQRSDPIIAISNSLKSNRFNRPFVMSPPHAEHPVDRREIATKEIFFLSPIWILS